MKVNRFRFIAAVLSVFLMITPFTPSCAGGYASTISSIHSTFSRQNTYADNIYQQICNGTYRSTELCEVIATILDK